MPEHTTFCVAVPTDRDYLSDRFYRHFNDYRRIGASYIKLNSMLRYKAPLRKVSLFAVAGISNGLAVSETSYSKIETVPVNSPSETKEGPAVNEFKKYERGFVAGAGIGFNRYSLSIRNEMSNGMSHFVNNKSHVNRLSALATINF